MFVPEAPARVSIGNTRSMYVFWLPILFIGLSLCAFKDMLVLGNKLCGGDFCVTAEEYLSDRLKEKAVLH